MLLKITKLILKFHFLRDSPSSVIPWSILVSTPISWQSPRTTTIPAFIFTTNIPVFYSHVCASYSKMKVLCSKAPTLLSYLKKKQQNREWVILKLGSSRAGFVLCCVDSGYNMWIFHFFFEYFLLFLPFYLAFPNYVLLSLILFPDDVLKLLCFEFFPSLSNWDGLNFLSMNKHTKTFFNFCFGHL